MAGGTLDDRAAAMKARMMKQNNERRVRNLGGFHKGLGAELKCHSVGHDPVEVKHGTKLVHRKSITWTRAQYRRATGPMVYIYWSHTGNGKKALYVGKSRNGLTRALDLTHDAKPARDIATEFEFILCASDEDAISMEQRLISELRPSYNTVLYK